MSDSRPAPAEFEDPDRYGALPPVSFPDPDEDPLFPSHALDYWQDSVGEHYLDTLNRAAGQLGLAGIDPQDPRDKPDRVN